MYEACQLAPALEKYKELLACALDEDEAFVRTRLATIQIELDTWDEVEEILTPLLQNKAKLSKHELAQTHWLLGDAKTFSGVFEESLEHIKQAENLNREINNISGLVDCSITRARYERHAGQLEDSLSTLQNAIQLAQSLNYHRGLARAINDLAAIYILQGDQEQAFSHGERARELAIETNDQYNLMIINNDLAFLCLTTGQHARAIQYCRQAYEIARIIGNVRFASAVVGNVGEIFRVNGDFEQAMLCARYGLSNALKTGDIVTMIYTAGTVANISFCSKQFDQAITVFKPTIELIKQQNMLKMPGSPFTFYTYALTLSEAGNDIEAKNAAQIAADVAEEISDTDILFRAQLLLLTLLQKLEEIPVEEFTQLALKLMDTDTEDEYRALTYEAIALCDVNNADARTTATGLYQKLFEEYQAFEYKEIYERLTDQKLPDLSELPPMIDKNDEEFTGLTELVQLLKNRLT